MDSFFYLILNWLMDIPSVEELAHQAKISGMSPILHDIGGLLIQLGM
jgi:hypothetical protein